VWAKNIEYLIQFILALKECGLNIRMIYGHGVDIMQFTRFCEMDDLRLEKLAKRILTDDELKSFIELPYNKKTQYVAKMWAAKEAISKSFGTGIRDDVTWKNIQIYNDHLGCPKVIFLNNLSQRGFHCYLSISHHGDSLIASAILQAMHVH
jgi:holo-[acyl-carrier protein] synthase